MSKELRRAAAMYGSFVYHFPLCFRLYAIFKAIFRSKGR